MNRKISLFLVGFIFSFSAFSQDVVKLNFCNKTVSEVTIRNMIECKTISTDNPDYKVFSFALGFISGKDYKEGKMTDNVISDAIINLLKEDNPNVVYIEQIVAINKQGKKITLEPFKVKK